MSNDYSDFFGWHDDQHAVENVMSQLEFPVFGDVWAPIKDSGKGKVVLLYDIITKVAGAFPLRKQTIGDCVSMGAAYAVDAAKAVDIFINKDFEEWVAETCTEDIYGGSRVQIGKGRLGSGDGSVGAWAADYVNKFGALPRQNYDGVDLTKYDGNRARKWGMPNAGVPSNLLSISKEHPIETVSLVTTYEQCRDLVVNGYAVTVASNQGFSSTRDKDGFAAPQGNWAHQMCVLGVDDSFKRPGVLIQNSWGVWNTGPKRNDQPDGSFWVDADVFEKRMLSGKDSWAYSGYKGFKPRKLNTRLF